MSFFTQLWRQLKGGTLLIALGIIILAAIMLLAHNVVTSTSQEETVAGVATGTPAAFVLEVYETIDENFWRDISEEDLNDLFARGIGQLTDSAAPSIANKTDLKAAVERSVATLDNKQGQQFPAQLADLVLRSLPPQGRSRLYTQRDHEDLANRVGNVNLDRNLYDVLGLSPEASQEELESTYQQRVQELSSQLQSTSTEQKLAELTYTRDVLTNEQAREQYDQNKSEPTVFTDRISGDIVHLAIHRYNSRTLKEFGSAVNKISMDPEPTALILDLRSNLGGTIDILPYLLGPFIGPDREAYRFFQQGEREPYRTQTGWLNALVPYKRVVILVDEQTQSTGELMASTLKKYNVGTVVGETTRGWGTVERVFPLENQYSNDLTYSVFLVHHLTLRADGQPIQDQGVVPEVEMSKADWQEELSTYLPDAELLRAVGEIWNSQPPGTQLQ